ncbi:uncharacterized protein AKAME5_002611500 [Lates japonicus]|uniref:Uncharacterized protein n=1 Tax=Lates japonicus TaxID=270547 RepID=A0AAD3NLW4_LATJO|nr:uncharacterized protein AKAME5_002611500 [Lates japonicus]
MKPQLSLSRGLLSVSICATKEKDETVRGPDDLYTVSSRVTVEKRHSNSFTCRVQQNKTNQTTETEIHVPDEFFVAPSSPSWAAYVSMNTVLGLMTSTPDRQEVPTTSRAVLDQVNLSRNSVRLRKKSKEMVNIEFHTTSSKYKFPVSTKEAGNMVTFRGSDGSRFQVAEMTILQRSDARAHPAEVRSD